MTDWSKGAMTIKDAEEFSGLKRTTLYALMGAGSLVFSKVGARRLISRASIESLLEAGVSHPKRDFVREIFEPKKR